ncbi:hypothetical protein CDD80_2098 [Ophiocordyceps camponoti-rufipedis]|uniref:BSD domain-containing protein n=1 Tax=Ophiocordyceps camponoti-rufipedis TaxID=2004952 RepID=A0A2C5ZMP9_9HYPO|nr:hypothetical protein CDD80_2098 [Ophiocordyceps camponoti-rufipedis]
MLKIFEKASEGQEATTYLFHFYSSEARTEAKALKDVLSRLLADARNNDSSLPKPSVGTSQASELPDTGGAGGTPASITLAGAASSQPFSSRWFDDNQLKNDIELQQSLMKKDKSLHQTYMEAMTTKPESISGAAFNSQFWSTRVNLLRAHAIDSNQKKGAYNVLSTIKPRTVDGELKLNISVEQVQLILAQHPLVKRLYNENVPKLSEYQFWSRFFLSGLAKSLRGENIDSKDLSDALFDKYNVSDNTEKSQSKIMAQGVPHMINLEANEENQGGFKGGNAKDKEMRPQASQPIFKTLNSLSEKIMANVSPFDIMNNDGQGPNDQYGGELSLRDLKGDAEAHRVALHIKDQNRFFSSKEMAPTANALLFSKQDPADVLATLKSFQRLKTAQGGGTAIQASINFNEESDSEEESLAKTCVGSRAAIRAAELEVMKDIVQQRAQELGPDGSSPMGLPSVIAEKCALTHATTVEFLHQFWNAFLSGDLERAPELQYLAESLKLSETRISAVADGAEVERQSLIRKRKQEIREHFERTGKKIRWKSDMIGGGRDAVKSMMHPILQAITKAQADYGMALAAEGAQVSID